MRIKSTELHPYPGYEAHIAMNLDTDEGGNISMQELQQKIKKFKKAPGTTLEDKLIPGTEKDTELKVRIIKPANLPEHSPIIMDVHGGGFVSGDIDIDNYRNVTLAELTPAIVVAVEYRLASKELPFPAQMLDCYTAYKWLLNHAEEIGGDPKQIGFHGTSAGGNLCAGLALYLRDKGEQQPALNVLVCPVLTLDQTESKLMFGHLGKAPDKYADEVEAIYSSPNGKPVSYYAMPAYCPNLQGLGPHMVITAEYDPLRDEGLSYATKLLSAKVPTEIINAPGVTHGFCVNDEPLTHWVHCGIAAAFRRNFGMKITEF